MLCFCVVVKWLGKQERVFVVGGWRIDETFLLGLEKHKRISTDNAFVFGNLSSVVKRIQTN